ncbi:MAG: protein-L-isoaspartate(D-aspartate) O-methyltransferase [candidate division KSB1 bacterium]|nr:protein-L-isoaspartate(D-aspartate) O-methyltransferase [candidate division KSB1 bacterium]
MKDRQPSMEELQKQREKMVQFQIKARGVSDPKVLQAMLRVPRHEFVPATYRDDAYEDFPLPIGYGQTISQPYIVAYMTEALELKGGEKVLEIGTGSGYQAAILAEIAGQVYSIEIVEPLCREAAQRLQQLGYTNVSVRCGDGYAGWPEAAPFDAIILTAAPEEIPQPLVDQLAEGGRMILPLGRFSQNLVLLTKQEGKVNKRNLLPVRFVPMTGKAEEKLERK